MRFIPAGAGNTSARQIVMIVQTVYPRWRGEHLHHRVNLAAGIGLSPLARGTPLTFAIYIPLYRFIPAGAGNTMLQLFWCSRQTVYPRWRGEHLSANPIVNLIHGLSPLARGTLTTFLRSKPCNRFIPAGAGNTEWFRSSGADSPVYPRWRGEHEIG